MNKAYYLDSSGLVKRYVAEVGTDLLTQIFNEKPEIFTASLTYAEIYSALCRLEREGQLSPEETGQAFAAFEKDWDNMKIVEFSGDIRSRIPKLLRRFPLRGSDAIHLVSALGLRERGIDCHFVVADKRLLNAATDFGLDVVNPALPR